LHMNQDSKLDAVYQVIKPYRSSKGLLLRAVDMLLICLCLVGSMSIMQRGSLCEHYQLALLAGIILFTFFAYVFSLYPNWINMSRDFGIRKVFQVWFLAFAFLLFLGFATKTTENYSRLVMGFWFVSVPLALITCRLIWVLILRKASKRKSNLVRVAVAGAGDVGSRMGQMIVNNHLLGMRIVAFYDDYKPYGFRPLPDSGVQVHGTLDDLCVAAAEGSVDQIYLALPLRAENRLKEIVQKLGDSCADVFVIPDLFVFDLLQAQWHTIQGLPVVRIFGSPHTGIHSWVKKLTDYTLAAVILILISVPMICIAAGVKLSSPGPVFFRQKRFGLNGQEVVIWKFRTMTVCEDGTTQCIQARAGDSRTTPFGAFLRRYSLDELPQFINVLQGRLSVVGPRPHAVAHNHEYGKRIPSYMRRHKVKPGITGWAQVNGWRGETDTIEKMEKRVEYDMEYIRNWSPLWDLKIVFQTIGAVLNGKAY